MKLSVNNMKMRADTLRKWISSKELALAKAPEGRIRANKSRNRYQYYYIDGETGDTGGKYMGVSDLALAAALDQKDYDERIIKAAGDELKTLNILIRKYENGTCEDIYSKLSLPRRRLVVPVMDTDEEFVRKWLGTPYTGLGFEEGDTEYYSERGLRVRSKNEIIAADKYDKAGIPYKFECPVYLGGYGVVYPDFTLLNVRQRKIYYQEIMGKMTDADYADKNVGKIQAYERNGIITGKDLILTFDTKAHPMLPKDIDIIIKNFLL